MAQSKKALENKPIFSNHHLNFAEAIVAHTSGFEDILKTWTTLDTEQKMEQLSRAFFSWRYISWDEDVEEYESDYTVIGQLDECVCGHAMSDYNFMINDISKTLAFVGNVCIMKLGNDPHRRAHAADERKRKHHKALTKGLQVRQKCPYCYISISRAQNETHCDSQDCRQAQKDRLAENIFQSCSACQRLVIKKGAAVQQRCEECELLLKSTNCRRCQDCLIALPKKTEHWVRRCLPCFKKYKRSS